MFHIMQKIYNSFSEGIEKWLNGEAKSYGHFFNVLKIKIN